MKASSEVMASASPRQFVKVAPPTVHAGVGAALRQAFALDSETRATDKFRELLERLN